MFLVVTFPKLYPACQTDENGIKPGSNLPIAESSKAEILGIKPSVCDV